MAGGGGSATGKFHRSNNLKNIFVEVALVNMPKLLFLFCFVLKNKNLIWFSFLTRREFFLE